MVATAVNVMGDAKIKNLSDWRVYSTSISESSLLLMCSVTGNRGMVSDPSPEEWQHAFSAPSKPYKWEDLSRVTLMPPQGPENTVHCSLCGGSAVKSKFHPHRCWVKFTILIILTLVPFALALLVALDFKL